MVGSIPLAWISPRTLVIVQYPGTFDDHWVLDAALKASRGIYFLRDVVFLYGPLGHWLLGAPARWAGLSMGAIYTSYNTLLLWTSFVLGLLTLRLLLPEQPAWKRALLLIVLSVFWAPWDGRTAFAIFLFAVAVRGWYAVREKRLLPLAFGAGIAALIALGFLYSADTGTYGVAAWLLAWFGVAWEGRSEWRNELRDYVAAGVSFAFVFLLCVLLINVLTFHLFDFQFWRSALALVSVHRWNEPAPMSDLGAMHLFVPLAVGVAVFVLRWLVTRGREESVTARQGFLLSAFLFALLAMQSGLVRSDVNHIAFAVYPMVLFIGAILFSLRGEVVSAITVLAVVACSPLLADAAPIFTVASFRYRHMRMRYPMTVCPAGLTEVSHACYPESFAQTLTRSTGFMDDHSMSSQPVVIFPYQYMYAVAAKRNVASGIEQSFLSVGPYLTGLDIAAMQRAAAPTGLYFPQGKWSSPIDDVSNFTRSADVWMWILEHYRSEENISPDILGLLKDDARADQLTMQAQPLGLAARSYDVDGRSASIPLGAVTWTEGTDFLRLRLKVKYGLLWKLRKPERIQLELTRADGSTELKTFVIEPGVSSEIWFYPWQERDLANYFSADPAEWRTGKRPPVTSLSIVFTPFDWVSQTPSSVTVEAADAVRLGMNP